MSLSRLPFKTEEFIIKKVVVKKVLEPYNKDPSSVVSSKKALILSQHSEGEDTRSSGVCLFDYRVFMERMSRSSPSSCSTTRQT